MAEKNIDPLFKEDKTWESERGTPYIASSIRIGGIEIISFFHSKGTSYVMHQQI